MIISLLTRLAEAWATVRVGAAPPLVARLRPPVLKAVDGEDTMVRLDKLLAERGAGSRKDIDRLIRKGLVELDGEVVGKNGAKLKVPWGSAPIVDGFDYPPPPLLAAYHKPLGVVSTTKDERGRPDLSSVLPMEWQKALHVGLASNPAASRAAYSRLSGMMTGQPVGRLDADTTGLLLFSRDGDLTHRLLHPKYVVEREYVAEVEGEVEEAALRRQLEAGVETTEDGETLVVHATLVGVERGEEGEEGEVAGQSVRLTVTEGKHRMVRRLLANCGHPVLALHRLRYGAIVLEELQIEEGEAAPIEGDALLWALQLSAAAAAAPPPSAAAAPPGEAPPAPPSPPPSPPPSESARRVSRVTAEAEAAPARDLDEEMEEARWREWSPRPDVVEAVMLAAEVEWDEALCALRRERGGVVEAIEALKNS